MHAVALTQSAKQASWSVVPSTAFWGTLLRSLGILTIVSIFPSPSQAIDCKSLEPTTGSNIDQTYQGKLNGKIDGAFRRFIGGDVDAEGTYHHIQNDVLKEYPEASRTFIWERFIYLQCQLLDSSHQSEEKKQAAFQEIISKYDSVPKEQTGATSGPIQNCTNNGTGANCTQTNEGK